MGRQTQGGNEIKVCRVCNVVLEIGGNWAVSFSKQRNYICRDCKAANVRRYRAVGEPVLEKINRKDKPVKVCCVCKVELTAENWTTGLRSIGKYVCRTCRSRGSRVVQRRVKFEVMEKYGGKCLCCGETSLEFLCIDHINGGGSRELRTSGLSNTSFYRQLLREVKRDDLRVLCHNCNFSFGAYGYCPHEVERGTDINLEVPNIRYLG